MTADHRRARLFHDHDERIDVESLGLATDFWINIAKDLVG